MIKDTNPDHYKVDGANFIKYINDPKVSGFGNWMFANGYNSGVWASSNWISVKDRLPEEKENPYTQDYQEVLCVLKTRFGTDVRVYKFGKGHFWNGPQEIDRMISHWMPFPELPKEESND